MYITVLSFFGLVHIFVIILSSGCYYCSFLLLLFFLVIIIVVVVVAVVVNVLIYIYLPLQKIAVDNKMESIQK